MACVYSSIKGTPFRAQAALSFTDSPLRMHNQPIIASAVHTRQHRSTCAMLLPCWPTLWRDLKNEQLEDNAVAPHNKFHILTPDIIVCIAISMLQYPVIQLWWIQDATSSPVDEGIWSVPLPNVGTESAPSLAPQRAYVMALNGTLRHTTKLVPTRSLQ